MAILPAAPRRCRACSRQLAGAPSASAYCAGCRERLPALDPNHRLGLLKLLWLSCNVALIAAAILIIVFALALFPVWLVAQIGPAGFLSYFVILPLGAAFGSALEHVGLRVPTRKRKVL